jgi:non-ribosomal peptide synthetase component F
VWPAGTAERFDVRPGLTAQPARRPPVVLGTGIAQVIFTSGSTGQPKGVLCSHVGFANRIRWMQRAFPLTGADRVALKTPFTFDVAGWELFWPQYAGAQTVVVSPGEHTSPEALTATFTKHAVTVAHFVPSMLALWLRADGARRCPDLRMVFCSGEALGAGLVAEFRRQSGAQLHNLYGPAEASIDVTHFRAGPRPRTPVPIGRAIDNTRVLHPFEPPAPGLETRIAAVWEQVLNLEGIGRNDDFRELGGNSLSAVETCYLLAERLGLDYDSDLLAEMIMNGNTIASAARIAIDGGIEDS